MIPFKARPDGKIALTLDTNYYLGTNQPLRRTCRNTVLLRNYRILGRHPSQAEHGWGTQRI
jgi:hypothetical protein